VVFLHLCKLRWEDSKKGNDLPKPGAKKNPPGGQVECCFGLPDGRQEDGVGLNTVKEKRDLVMRARGRSYSDPPQSPIPQPRKLASSWTLPTMKKHESACSLQHHIYQDFGVGGVVLFDKLRLQNQPLLTEDDWEIEAIGISTDDVEEPSEVQSVSSSSSRQEDPSLKEKRANKKKDKKKDKAKHKKNKKGQLREENRAEHYEEEALPAEDSATKQQQGSRIIYIAPLGEESPRGRSKTSSGLEMGGLSFILPSHGVDSHNHPSRTLSQRQEAKLKKILGENFREDAAVPERSHTKLSKLLGEGVPMAGGGEQVLGLSTLLQIQEAEEERERNQGGPISRKRARSISWRSYFGMDEQVHLQPMWYTALQKLLPKTEGSEAATYRIRRKRTVSEERDNGGGTIIISSPSNARHRVHVDFEYNWTGEDPFLQFELTVKLGQG